MKLLAITSCPNGIAHTYMAAENLQKAAEQLNVEIKVETQGSIGVENEFTKQDIQEADGIIIAADKTVNKERFVGKKVIAVGVQEGINSPEKLINRMIQGDATVYQGSSESEASSNNEEKDTQNPFYRHLMNGVSYMIPFIVIGGLLIAISLTLGGVSEAGGIKIPEDSFWKTIESIGGASFSFMVPILAGFIAYSIADRPGLAPGMVGGYIATHGSLYGSEAGAGFLGGIVAGFLAGYVALWIKKIKVPQVVQPIMPIIVIPVLASLAVGLIFVTLIGAPIAQVFVSLTNWLEGMQGTSSVLLALILGGMIAFDMGGPVNKVAFLFGSAMIGEGNYEIMGPIAAAIAIPPIGMGLATFINKKKFASTEIETGKASFTMGLFGITEGAIPFAAQDPFRVIPSNMVGAMVGAVIAMLGGVGDRVAHGGPIVGVLGAVDNVFMFFVAIAVGSLVTAFTAILLKKDVTKREATTTSGEEQTSTPVEDNTIEQEAEEATPTNNEKETEEVTKLVDITSKNLIETELQGTNQDEVIDEMIERLHEEGVVQSKADVKEAILAREAESTTGIGMNIAIPHAKSNAVTKPRVVFGIKQDGVDWNSFDGTPAKLIFMITVPKDGQGDQHLKILQMLSRKLMDDDYREQLLNAKSKDEAYQLLESVE
ncbi:PTS fructose transporter subunit IIABC [Pontibacillus yanchengensis]|uniref:PTS mannose transporter subunit IIABC n=1 Tax=Pontibacillus yanchengensis Y32 TaxID=1385514 RepID=A0A0A2T8T2_9BACI|nr:PTS fructose transporter subunit IIABC [Pontibacillus yanchengensis]KGP71934.1 PTS mannose transporter subunit IIABC [Pontibacillus yanchengensis Y32]